jgi:hypothetical protein
MLCLNVESVERWKDIEDLPNSNQECKVSTATSGPLGFLKENVICNYCMGVKPGFSRYGKNID